MTNAPKAIRLEGMKNLSGKKEDKDNIYFYLDFRFNLHKMGDSASGVSLYRITPINFDNMLLKTFSKKTFPAKGFSTIESTNVKKRLKDIFDQLVAVKAKKDTARKAYEKAKREGTLPEEEPVLAKEDKPVRKGQHLERSEFRRKLAEKKNPKVAADSYRTYPSKVKSESTEPAKPAKATGHSFDKAFGKARHIKKNEDFKRDRNFEKNESFNFDKEKKVATDKPYSKDKSFSKDKPYSKDKSFSKDKPYSKDNSFSKDKSYSKNKPAGKFDSRDNQKSFNREDSSAAGMNKFNKNSREFSKDSKDSKFDNESKFNRSSKPASKNKPAGKSFSGSNPFKGKGSRPTSSRNNY